MKIHPAFLFPLLLIFGSACEDELTMASRTESLDEFSLIELNDVFDVYLAEGSENKIEIVADGKILPDIVVKNDSGKVSLSNRSTGKWISPADNRVSLYFSLVSGKKERDLVLIVNETCKIQSVNTIHLNAMQIINHPRPKLMEIDLSVDCNHFFYWNNFQCGGKVSLRGVAASVDIRSFAMMTVDASKLLVMNANIENSSKGDCRVNVSDKIEYSIYGTGNIYLSGNPPEIILKEKTSSGRLIPVN